MFCIDQYLNKQLQLNTISTKSTKKCLLNFRFLIFGYYRILKLDNKNFAYKYHKMDKTSVCIQSFYPLFNSYIYTGLLKIKFEDD